MQLDLSPAEALGSATVTWVCSLSEPREPVCLFCESLCESLCPCCCLFRVYYVKPTIAPAPGPSMKYPMLSLSRFRIEGWARVATEDKVEAWFNSVL